MSKRALFSMLVLVAAFGFGLVGCSSDDDDDPIGGGDGGLGPIDENVELTCIECHTSQEALEATVEPEEEAPEAEGEG